MNSHFQIKAKNAFSFTTYFEVTFILRSCNLYVKWSYAAKLRARIIRIHFLQVKEFEILKMLIYIQGVKKECFSRLTDVQTT